MSQGPAFPTDDRHAALRGHLLRVYAGVLAGDIPAGDYLEGYFRLNPGLARKARGFLAAVCFALLRDRIRLLIESAAVGRVSVDPGEVEPVARLLHRLEPGSEALLSVYRWLHRGQNLDSVEALDHARHALEQAARAGLEIDLERAIAQLEDFAERLERDPELSALPETPRLSAQISLPVEMVRRWSDRFGADECRQLGQAFAHPAPFHIRVNQQRLERDRAVELLRREGFDPRPCRFSPHGVDVRPKKFLGHDGPLPSGAWEVQDEGSQLVSLAVDPCEGWTILDACAGAGGKALHLADLAGRGARIIAHDANAARMEKLPARAARAGFDGITVVPAGEAARHAPYDAVLVDAPCLGLGRLRRDPATAWRGPDLKERLRHIVAVQSECLDVYTPLVKPGGVLVYAVCSFEPEETFELIAAHPILVEHFTADPLPALFQRTQLAATRSADGSQMTLLPHLHGTDGFFIARLRRRA